MVVAAVVLALPLATLGLSIPASATGSTPSTTTLGSVPASPSGLGVSVTYTATVAPTSGSGVTPTGTVSFTDAGNTMSGCGAVTVTPSTASSATATCVEAAASMTGGTHAIVASYGGDATYATSGANLTQNVDTDTTTTTVASSPVSPSPFGVAVTYTATVTAGGGQTTFTPTGTVAFVDGSTTLCASASLSPSSAGVAKATCLEAASAMTVGTHAVTATYAPDSGPTNFTTSNGTLTQTVDPDATTTVVTASPSSPSGLGVAVTYTVTVTAQNATTTDPTGTVTVADGSSPLTCSALSGSGGVVTATCTEPGTSMTAGSHAISATYDGDANFATSTDAITQSVAQVTTATAVTSTTGSPSPAGQAVTYEATITASSDPFAMTGTVAFKDGATAITGCTAVTVAAGGGGATASCTEAAASMTPGTHVITAVYAGDTNYVSSTSAGFSQVIVQDATTTSVMSTANPSTGGLGVTYTATVSATGGSAFTPSGTVTFKDGPTTVCAAVALSAASAHCAEPAASMTSGTHSITAVYSGDTNFTTSTGLLSQVVDPAPVSISESANPASPSGLGVAVVYTVTLTAGNSSAFVPGVTGTPPPSSLTVTDTPPGSSTPVTLCTLSTPFSTGSTAGAGVSTWECAEPAADMTAGVHTIGVSFAGDTYFGPATGSFAQDVAFHMFGSTTTVTSPGSPSYPGQALTYTASVSGDALFAPSGTVTFYSGATPITGCTAVPPTSSANNASTYRCTEPGADLATGTQTIHAVFAGDSNYGTSTSTTITQVVSQGATSVTVGDAVGSTNPSAAGIPVTYLATVAPSQTTAIEPTGTVTFYDGQTVICATVALTPGASDSTAPCTESSAAMTLGLHPTAAIYSGDANYVASDNTGSPFAQQVDQNTTTTTVAGPGPGTYPAGLPLQFTATVTGTGAGNLLTPTGTVTFSDASGTLCSGAGLSGSSGVATASCTFSSPDFTVGPTDTVTATYGGDTNYTTSHGSTSAPSFVQATANVALVSTTADHPTIGNASTVGLPVTYTATFTDPSGGLVTPTGTVAFTDGGATLAGCGAVTLAPSSAGTATASCVDTPSVVGPHTIAVVYVGDTNFTAAIAQTPDPFVQHVVPPDTSIAITAPTPANADTTPVNTQIYPVWTPVTLQATVTGGPGGSGSLTSGGDGTVTFYLNGVAIDPADFPHSPLPVPDCAGLSLTSVGSPPSATISCPGFPMPTGNDTFTAAYLDTSGASGYATVLTPTAYTWQVVAYSTNTQITASPSAPVTGQPVTVTATVTPASGAAALPTGTLAFTVNGLPVTCASPATLNGANPPQATCTLTGGLPGGADVIQASYTGDVATAGSGGRYGWYAGSTGSLGLTVARAPTTVKGFSVVPASGSGTPVSGQTLKFSVTSVAAVAPGAGQPTGTVAITTPSTFQTLCTITLVNGAGSCFSPVQVPSGPSVGFTATYSGDTGFQPSSASTSLAVGSEKALVTAFTTSPTPLVYGQPVTFSVTLSPQFAGTFATGSVAITSAQTGAQTLCTISLVTSSANTGSCTFTPTPSTGYIGAGAAQFTATYSGDANFATGTTGQTTAFVNKSTATVGITVNPQNPVYGQYPSFGLTVTPATPGTVPTGTVTVTSSQTGLNPLCTYNLSGGLAGSCTDSRLLTAQNNVTFTATYTGDANFAAASGSTLTNVQKAATTTTVTPTPSAPVYGAAQTFSVSVAPQVAGVDPTGTATVTTPGVLQPLCTVTLVAGAGSCVSSANVPTSTGIVYQAAYSGDPNFLASVGTSSNNTVGQATSTTTLALSSASSLYGVENAQVFTATVAPQVSGTPTGTVEVKAGSVTLCTVILVAGTGTCSPGATALAPSGSAYTITAVYGGDANFSGSVSAAHEWSVTQSSVGLSASVSTSTVVYGNEAVALFSATVSAPGAGTPTGTVAFKTGTATLCLATVVAGQASCALGVTLGVNGSPYAVSATYSGDANFAAASVSTISLTVVKASTTLALSITGNPTVYGNEHAPVFTVSAAPQFSGGPTGTVALTTGTTALCTVTLVSGTGSCQLASPTALPAGSYTVVATYGGDTNFTGSGAFGFLTVSQAATESSVSFTPSSLTTGAETLGRFTPTLSLNPSPNGAPSGVVTVTATSTATDLPTTVCTVAAVSATGATSCSPGSTSLLAPGTYNISVAYPGDQNFGASSGSAAGQLTVTQAAASSLSLSLSPSASTVTYGDEQSVTYGVSFGPAVPAPTGAVTVKTGTTTLCTVLLSAGSGSCAVASPTTLSVSATNPVVATYAGDVNYSGTVSSSAPVNLAVTQATTTTSLSITPTSVTYGAENAAVFTISVTPQFAGAPTGTVTVKTATTTLCMVTLPATSCSTSAAVLPGAAYSATATYSGDANFVTSVSASAPFTVTPAATATSLVLSSASVPFGTSPTFTARVSTATSGTPTGTVTVETYVLGAAVTLCTFSLPATSCQGTGQSLVVQGPPYSVLAVYSGDTNFVGSTSPSQNLTIVAQQTSTTMSPLVPSSVVYGHESTVTFGVQVDAPTAGALTGTVTFEAAVGPSSVALCTATLTVSSGGAGSCTTADTTLPASSTPYAVTAVYGGDANFEGSTSQPSLLTVTQANSSTAVIVAPSTVIFGDVSAAVFSVTLTGQYAGTPTGTVVLTTGTTTLCTATLSGAHGTCSAPSGLQLAPGNFTILATYSGDGNFATSTHTDVSGLTVDKSPTTTLVTVTPFTVVYGAENLASFTVTVVPQFAGTEPTGTVTLTVPGTPGPTTVCTVTLVAGTAKCSPTAAALLPSPLSYTVTATYPGDTNFVTSSGKTTLTVTRGTANLSVTSGSNPSLPGRPVTFTASAFTGSAAAIATGTVTFTDGTSTLCNAVPMAGGQARCTAALPLTPSQTVTATYSGDTNFFGSSATVVQSVEHGYWMVASDGGIFAFGDAHFYGSEGGKPLNRPIVGMAATPDAQGYWMVASDGGIFAFGDAGFYGSTGNLKLNSPIAGMATTPDGKGYWLVAADGGVFGFGDAHYYGSVAGKPLPAPIVGMVGTTTGRGYFLVAANGAVYAFGDAAVASSGGVTGSSPVVGLAATPSAAGYWLASANGGVFAFGDAKSFGSMAGKPLNKPIVGIGATADGQGYWLVASDGGIFAFGDAIFDGSTGNLVLNSPMVSLATI